MLHWYSGKEPGDRYDLELSVSMPAPENNLSPLASPEEGRSHARCRNVRRLPGMRPAVHLRLGEYAAGQDGRYFRRQAGSRARRPENPFSYEIKTAIFVLGLGGVRGCGSGQSGLGAEAFW